MILSRTTGLLTPLSAHHGQRGFSLSGMYYLVDMLRLKIIESPAYYTAVRQLARWGVVSFVVLIPILNLDSSEGVRLAGFGLVVGLLLFQVRKALAIRNDTERRRLEVDETGIGVREVKTKAQTAHWKWAELSDLELVADNNLADPTLGKSSLLFSGRDLANYFAFVADGQPHRYDFLLESDYAERRLRALVEEHRSVEHQE